MKPFPLRIFCFFLLISCADDEFNNSSKKDSMAMAAIRCQKTHVEMLWFQHLLNRVESDVLLQGDIYAIAVDGRTIFAHQPLVMSCYGCVLYDCDGNKIDRATVDHEKVVAGMQSRNRIYRAF